MKICIAGGGLAGLSLGYHLRNSEIDFKLLEKNERVGGLLRSEKIEGYTFDAGGSHILFSKNEDVLNEMVNLVGNVVMHRRRTFIFYRNQFIKYPFENGIFMLSPEERFEILEDFVRNLMRDKKKPENLRELFLYLFGEKITEKYLGPYNEKIWKRKLEDMVLGWGEDRIPTPPVEDVLKAAVGIETEGYLHQLRFFYPLDGGIESLAKAVAGKIVNRIETSTPVEKISVRENEIEVNGETYDYMVSTIPLPELGRIVGGEIRDLSSTLDYNSVTVVGLGVRGKVPDYHWVYVPRKDIIFHRIAFLSNYSPNMAPPGKSTIIAEISHRPGDTVKNPVDEVVEGLAKMGIDIEVEVEKVWVNNYAYVVTDKNYFSTLPKLREKLEEMRILTLGRHGNWEYINMDAVWQRAKDMAQRVGRLE